MTINMFGKKPDYKFPKGAYVKDSKGVEYWLLASEAEDWQDKATDEAVTDEEFWKWWEEYKTTKHIPPRSGTAAWSSAPKGDGLSHWWQYDLHSAFGTTPKLTNRLALALSAVANVVRIIDESTPPYSVEWATDENSSTDIVDKRIFINSKPITKPGSLSNADAIDICDGFGLHEASHAQYTKDVHKQLEEPTKLEPVVVTHFLGNVLEDMRIERLTSKEYPGFAPYFDKTRGWMWESEIQGMLRQQADAGAPFSTEWGTTLRDALNAILMRIKWPNESADLLASASYRAEMPWWDDWNERYQTGAIGLRAAVIEALERLRQKENLSKEMDELPTATGGRLPKGTLPTCTNDLDDTDSKLDSDTAADVLRLVEEKLREWKPTEYPKVKRSTVFVRHPKQTGSVVAPKRSGLSERLKSVLRFRPELPHYSERLLRHGDLDEDQLHRFAMDDDRMFEKQVIEVYPNAQVSLLVDMSGSMQGGIPSGASGILKTDPHSYYSRLDLAEALSGLFIGALKEMEGVTPKVFGHTADLHSCEGHLEVYELWEPGESEARLGLITSMPSANNRDGYAIEYCVSELLDRGTPGDQRLLIVLSDGQPSADGYGGSSALEHVRAVTDAAEKKGVFVLQIGIASDLRRSDQVRMFKNWVEFTDYDSLPFQLTKVLSAFLNR